MEEAPLSSAAGPGSASVGTTSQPLRSFVCRGGCCGQIRKLQALEKAKLLLTVQVQPRGRSLAHYPRAACADANDRNSALGQRERESRLASRRSSPSRWRGNDIPHRL